MMAGLLLDTHIVLWLTSMSPNIRLDTRRRIEQVRADGGVIHVSPVTAWEIGCLVSKRRVRLNASVLEWLQHFLSQSGVSKVDVDIEIGCKAYELPKGMHGDPADRLLVATAIHLGCPLVTYDEGIIRFARTHGPACGFTVLT